MFQVLTRLVMCCILFVLNIALYTQIYRVCKGCEDIDDALHVRILPNGNYEVGVRKCNRFFITSLRTGECYSDSCYIDIADVTHFVKPGTSLDEEAAVRGTTVYLVN